MTETQTAQPEQIERFTFTDPRNRQTLELPQKIGDVDLKGLIEGVIAKSNEDFRKKYKGEIDNLSSQLSEADKLKARLDELESLQIPAKEREARQAQAAIEKAQKEAQTTNERATKFEQAFKAEKLNTAILQAAGKHTNIRNLDQVATLFKASCSPAVIEDNGEWKVTAKLNGAEFDLDQALSQFLALEQNSNLLSNQLAPGGGSAGGQRTQPSANKVTKAQFDAMSNADRFAFINNGGQLTT